MDTNQHLSAAEYDEVFQAARKIIAGYLRVPEDELQPDTHIMDELGADSLALVELGFQISERFGVPMLDTSGDKLIFKHLVAYILQNLPPK